MYFLHIIDSFKQEWKHHAKFNHSALTYKKQTSKKFTIKYSVVKTSTGSSNVLSRLPSTSRPLSIVPIHLHRQLLALPRSFPGGAAGWCFRISISMIAYFMILFAWVGSSNGQTKSGQVKSGRRDVGDTRVLNCKRKDWTRCKFSFEYKGKDGREGKLTGSRACHHLSLMPSGCRPRGQQHAASYPGAISSRIIIWYYQYLCRNLLIACLLPSRFRKLAPFELSGSC